MLGQVHRDQPDLWPLHQQAPQEIRSRNRHTHLFLDAPTDIQSTRAAARRERRIEAVPAPLRPAVDQLTT
ncbi:hypothetical protein OG765_00335 [Streptomyces sp. NBC_00555]|uniref:hypothetical protein n=1 Tax=Streptomyces sp. NBC_00555 TaxID=2903662 RepID=UPI002253220A|nr:hypothetical protein [Streptomyces sp. NBC_00555]MCX5009463.1 hypothetical protein [Streptomyces sp. NBC_00555]